MNFFTKTYRILALAINLVAGGLLLVSAYSYLVPPDKFLLPLFFSLAFPIFFFIECVLLLQVFYMATKIRPSFLLCFCYCRSTRYRTTFRCISAGRQRREENRPAHLQHTEFRTGPCHRRGGKAIPFSIWLRDSGADIICLQEYSTGRLSQKAINRVLSKYPYRHVFKPSAWDSGIACFSKYPIRKTETIPFDNSQNNACLYQFDIDGQRLTLINCHLESNHLEPGDKELYEQIAKHPTQTTELLPAAKDKLLRKLARAGRIRAQQARTIRSIADKIPGAVVICGDFNDTPPVLHLRDHTGRFRRRLRRDRLRPRHHLQRVGALVPHRPYPAQRCTARCRQPRHSPKIFRPLSQRSARL